MSTVELDLSRRDFLFGRSRRGRPPQSRESGTSRRRDRDDPGLTRRQAIPLIIAGTAVVGGVAAGLLRPWDWEWFNLPKEEPDTLQLLVNQAREMEDGFRGKDLSDRETRNQYTKLIADIFIKFYELDKLGVSRLQLLSSVVWINSKEVFEEIFIEQNQNPVFSREYLKQVANQTPAFTAKDLGKIYINTAYTIFQENLTSQDPKFPKGWNPLKSLRLILLHEFSHAISQPAEDTAIFSIVDSKNSITDKTIEGFRIKGFTGKNEFDALYDSLDEASVELLSKYVSTGLFHSFVSEYVSTEGYDVTAIMTRLEQLINSAQIDKIELARLHKTSNLRGFLLLLTERYGIDPQKVTEKGRILFGFSIFEALIHNNQAILQDYINSAKRSTNKR